jgi:hypothetical protein
VYVLQRKPLVEEREKTLIDIQAQIQRVNEALKDYSDWTGTGDSVKLMYFEKILKRELTRLRHFLDPKQPYLGMARQLLRKYLLANFNIRI